VLDDSYSTSGTREQTFTATFPNYEPRERYAPQRSFHPYSSSRPTTSHITGTRDLRRLPPLSTSVGSQAYRWQQPSYLSQSSRFSDGNPNRSPMASYPAAHPANQTYSSTYRMGQSHNHLASMNPLNHGPNTAFDDRRYSSHAPHVPLPRAYSPSPLWPIFPDERTIKEKRRRADAQTPLISGSSTKRTAEPLSRLWKSVLHSQICSTCLHAAYKYGEVFSRLLLIYGRHLQEMTGSKTNDRRCGRLIGRAPPLSPLLIVIG
jgi:hypothetical protein